MWETASSLLQHRAEMAGDDSSAAGSQGIELPQRKKRYGDALMNSERSRRLCL
jgi:hypothetical protein